LLSQDIDQINRVPIALVSAPLIVAASRRKLFSGFGLNLCLAVTLIEEVLL
jgi:hypothetical protein